MLGTENWEVCLTCWKHLSEDKKNNDNLCFLNRKRNYSQPSASTVMIQTSAPTVVYRRKKQHTNSVSKSSTDPSAGTEPNDLSLSSNSSECPTLGSLGHMVSLTESAPEAVKSRTLHPVGCRTGDAGSFHGYFANARTGSEEALISDAKTVLNVSCVNDNCSSSKSNLELSSASLKISMDDAGECSCSDELIIEKVLDEMSERDKCISILRSQGLLDRFWTRQERNAAKDTSENHCLKSCKVCGRMASTVKLLICDNCEDAFHVSCSSPHVKRIPVGEWLCSSCLKNKHKILKEKSISNSGNTSIGNPSSEDDLGSLEFMFRDTEPYMTNVRIGDEFQANVPVWSGPINDECYLMGDKLEVHRANNLGMQEKNSTKPVMLSSIGNWLQCKEVITGTGQAVDGSICGKWRRAPLFEVQTDEFECFSSVLWDPVHADCAVPQELVTEEVMKQLKYVEMLRPKLGAKRRKLDCSKSNG